ncbi:NAD(P)H-dependent flavin oxidoreductase YrpB, nitropropane dioxygenase family [Dendrosporobacter quercicolus]|uniref:Probable nitronate monooxygenase n=1 Tax=Dendrosporobacter quercicolus TaxID=146817 RepID=A0A1G9L947_9FIRM|nr:NAD(P)H-dependent flavin oxidoreductase YrpB, nitropropane dioxygenase family [Dendrosporobacter quercicolus]
MKVLLRDFLKGNALLEWRSYFLKLPELKIGPHVAKIPIIQGGMAIRISTARLAAAVAEQGGIGLIAASGMTFDELRYEIRLARSLTKGIVGINIMVAARQFAGIVKTAIEEGIDLVVAGAGFSRDMFGIGKESGTPIVPIVSSVKLAKISQALGASAIIVEGKEAGGHLGTDQPMKTLIPDIKKAVKIPVIGAGGVMSGQDIVDVLKLGADGVQMGTRFAASEESNAAPALKEFYLKAKSEDVVLIKSPVGLPGRAVRNPFAEKIMGGATPIDACDACLKHCAKNFCIIKALIRAQQGDVETGLVFTGEYIHKIEEILSVKEIFARLLNEVEAIN